MQRWKRWGRWSTRTARAACLSLLLWQPTLAWAQPLPGQGPAEPKSYVNQYALVGFCVALGFIVLCRPSKREEKVKGVGLDD